MVISVAQWSHHWRTQSPSISLLCHPQHVSFWQLVDGFMLTKLLQQLQTSHLHRAMSRGQKSKHFLYILFLISKENFPRNLHQTSLISYCLESHHMSICKSIPGKKNKTTIALLNQSHFTQAWAYIPWASWMVNTWTKLGFYWTKQKGCRVVTNIACPM